MPRALPLLLVALFAAPAVAGPTYWQDVRPILRKNCTVCHNARNLAEDDLSGGLSLDGYANALRWMEKGRDLVKAGTSADSLLHKVLVAPNADRRMPPGGKSLSKEEIAVVRAWIDGGAKEGERPTESGITTPKRPRRKLDVALRAANLTLTLKVGPLAPVVAVAFHPGGKLLAVGSYGQVTIWDLSRVAPAATLTGVLGAVNDVRFSPDGKLLAVGGGQPSAKGDLRLFTVADWKLKAVLPGHEDVVAGVAFRPDGKKLASASYDRTFRVWDVASGKLERTLTSHSDFVHAVAFTPDGKSLVSGSKDRSARLTEADTGAGKLTFGDREEDVLGVAVHPDGKSVVVSGREPALMWWNPETGVKIRSVGGHRGAVHEIAFSPDGKSLVSGGDDGTARVWDGTTGALKQTMLAGSIVYAVAISPDGKTVAAGCFDGLTRLFDATTGAPRCTLLSVHADHLAFSPSGYVAVSDALLPVGRWASANKPIPSDIVWKTFRQPALVLKSIAGQTVPAPTLPVK
jgi:WD40 repeat protein